MSKAPAAIEVGEAAALVVDGASRQRDLGREADRCGFGGGNFRLDHRDRLCGTCREILAAGLQRVYCPPLQIRDVGGKSAAAPDLAIFRRHRQGESAARGNVGPAGLGYEPV